MAGLYIHIPFCGSKCAYCDFYSVARIVTDGFLAALRGEMTFRRDFLRRPLTTIYFGGGTPSLVPVDGIRGILEHASSLWDRSGVGEITLEANPEDLTESYLEGLLNAGVNRLSVGVQSFDDHILRQMNRRHNASKAAQAIKTAQKAGFENVSVDLIYGVPGQTLSAWERTLDTALGLGVQHVSAYHLTIEPGTKFGCMAAAGKFAAVADAVSEQHYALLCDRLRGAGMEHYEISSWALPGRRSRHNSAYWTGAAYLGVGPSAHSYDGERRREWVLSDVARYIAHGPQYGTETLTDTDLRNERIMLGLRTAEGIESRWLSPADDYGAANVTSLLQKGLLVVENGRVRIPEEKFLIADYIIASLFDG